VEGARRRLTARPGAYGVAMFQRSGSW
jgi:hypothetical protein